MDLSYFLRKFVQRPATRSLDTTQTLDLQTETIAAAIGDTTTSVTFSTHAELRMLCLTRTGTEAATITIEIEVASVRYYIFNAMDWESVDFNLTANGGEAIAFPADSKLHITTSGVTSTLRGLVLWTKVSK